MLKRSSNLMKNLALLQISNRCRAYGTKNIKVGLLDVPFQKGQRRKGVEKGPQSIREMGLIEKFKEIRPVVDVKDYGEVKFQVGQLEEKMENMRNYVEVMSCNHEVSKNVEKIIKDGRICLTLGGDHSIGIGTVDGHIKAKDGNVSVLWIDAHSDINLSKYSPSGNMHGMPVAILAKEIRQHWNKLPGTEWLKPTLSVKHLAYIGLRSVDECERRFIHDLGITAFGMEEVDRYGVKSVVRMALDRIDPMHNRSIHMSFDIDSLDGNLFPSTGTPVPGGLTLREGMQIVEDVQSTGRLGAMDLVEVNPEIGTEQDIKTTVDAAHCVILAAFGGRRYMIPN